MKQPRIENGMTTLPGRETTLQNSPALPGITPDDESPEDTQLRREMLEYSMNEVGAIVAEMELEQDADTGMSDIMEDEEVDGETDQEEEDEFGGTPGKLISDDYRRQMLELERKLNARALLNVGPKEAEGRLGGKGTEPQKIQEGPGEQKEALEGPESPTMEMSDEKKPKKSSKGVRFADSLDIQEASPPKSIVGGASVSNEPIASSIIERAPREGFNSQRAAGGHLATIEPPNSGNLPIRSSSKPSKAIAQPAKMQLPDASLAKLEGKTHGDVLERSTQQSGQEAPEPDDLDPSLIRREVATNYHRQRNRMIQRNGGFTTAVDEEEIPVDENGRKMSRFKVARLSRTST